MVGQFDERDANFRADLVVRESSRLFRNLSEFDGDRFTWRCADCYFATKVWHAQEAGAAAVLVADNKQEELITMDSPEEDPAASQYLK